MIHIEIAVKLIAIVIGFKSLLGIYIFSNKLKSSIVRYYFLGYGSLQLFYITGFIFRYFKLTNPIEGFNLDFFTATLLFLIFSYYVKNIIRLTSSIVTPKRSYIPKLSQLAVTLIYLTLYINGLSYGGINDITLKLYNNMWLGTQAIHFPVLIISLVLIIRSYKKLENKLLKKVIKAFLIMAAIYIPTVVIEEFIPVKSNLKAYNFFYIGWSILSSYTLFKGRNSYNVKEFNFDFSPREGEIFQLLIKNFTSNTIGEELYISPRTVEKHISNIYKKVGVKSKRELLKKL